MALFTDGPAATIEGLREYESSILDVASTEGIDLTVKLGVAQKEIGIALQQILEGRDGVTLNNVVVTEPIRAWTVFKTLALTFRDAYHQQLNDRYLAKLKEYEKQTEWASDALVQLGVGVHYQPVPRGAIPVLGTFPAPMAAAAYWVQTTWTAPGGEGGASEVTAISVPAGAGISAAVSGAPQGVLGWNVYAACSGGTPTRQNDEPLAPGVTWFQSGEGLRAGVPAGEGQAPQAYVKRLRRLR